MRKDEKEALEEVKKVLSTDTPSYLTHGGWVTLRKGDSPGHEFRGNQYTEGSGVTITGEVSNSGKHGTVHQVAPSGHYYGVKDSKGKHLGYYHESNLKPRGLTSEKHFSEHKTLREAKSKVKELQSKGMSATIIPKVNVNESPSRPGPVPVYGTNTSYQVKEK